MNVFSTWNIMQFQEFPELSPCLVTAGEDLPVGVVTGVSTAEFSMSKEGAESSAPWEDCFLQCSFSTHPVFISNSNERNHDGSVQRDMALQWCRQNTVWAKSSETGRGIKLLCNSLWSIRQGKKKKRVKMENLTKCIHLEEFPTSRQAY